MKPASHAKRHVAVLGASNKSLRYSNQAVRLLLEKGFPVTPIHPRIEVIEGLPVVSSLQAVRRPVDTLTLYLGAERMRPLIDAVVDLKPGRVIFNPGSESCELKRRLEGAGIHWLEACTLVMLRIGTF
jgi:predicted CoA-binding protein